MTKLKSERLQLGAVISLAALALAVTLFSHWELTDGLKYWYFARVFEETGRFITFDGSPLYTLYLNAFRWLGYPTSVSVEYIVSTGIVMASLIVLLKHYVGVWLAAVGVLAWLPFLATAEPVAVQQLALASSCLALVARRSDKPTTRYFGFYALLLIGYMLRTSYLMFILLFLAWDLYLVFKHKEWWKERLRSYIRSASQFTSTRRIRPSNAIAMVRNTPLSVLAIVLLVGFFVWSSTAQSPHPWNNIYVNSTEWYPIRNGAKSHADAYFIQGFNWRYAEYEYGSAAGHDFYFTNDELFDGADNSLDALQANPRFIVEQGWRNVKQATSFVPQITVLPAIHQNLRLPLWEVFNAVVLVALIFGSFKAVRDGPMRIFVVGSIILSASAALVLPQVIRHYVPLVPVLVLSAGWYGARLQVLLAAETPQRQRLLFLGGAIGIALIGVFLLWNVFIESNMRPIMAVGAGGALLISGAAIVLGRDDGHALLVRWRPALRRTMMWSAVPVAVVLFSNGLVTWGHNLNDLGDDARNGTLEILQSRDTQSMNASLGTLKSLIHGCNGIMTLEHHFLGSFAEIPRDKIYDVWEIPPFGELGDSEYNGLRPDRIDCVLESVSMANADMRYSKHIQPYIKRLQDMGATTVEVPNYGRFIALSAGSGS